MEIKLYCYKYREEHKFTLESKNLEIKELKKRLQEEINVNINDINFLFGSQNLDNEKTLEDYNIQNGSTIFYQYKKPKAIKFDQKKKETNINNKDDNINIDKNKNNNINNKNTEIKNDENKNRETPDLSAIGNFNLKVYSSIIKLLTYKNEDNMEIILKNLKEQYKNDFKEISTNKNTFIELLKKPITKNDIEVYKKYYHKAKNLLEKPGNHEQFEILITDSEEEYIQKKIIILVQHQYRSYYNVRYNMNINIDRI